MDLAAFQSTYPEEVRIQQGRTSWCGYDLQYYNAKSGTWFDLAQTGEAMMFPSKEMQFGIIDGLIKSSIVSNKEFAIIVEGDLLGFVRGVNLTSKDDEEMDIKIDWDSGSETDSVDFEATDMFSPENDLKELL